MVLNEKLKILTKKELLRSLPNAKNEWKTKTPFEKWCYLFSIGKLACDILSLPVFRDNVKDVRRVRLMGNFHWLYIVTQIVLTFYTMYYYTSNGEFQMGLPCTCMAGICIAHIPLGIFLTGPRRFNLSAVISYGGRYIYQDTHADTKYNRICSEQLDITIREFVSKKIAIWASFIVCIRYPVYALIAYGTKTTTTELHWPFLEPKSNAEFFANAVLQATIAAHAIVMYLNIETVNSIFANTVSIIPRVIQCDFEDTARMLKNKTISNHELNCRIRNITLQCLDSIGYISSLSDMLYWRNLFNSGGFSYMIGMSIYCQYKLGFAAGYGMAVMQWIQWYYVCEGGELIQDNGFIDILYDFEWEILPIEYRRQFSLILGRLQNEKGLKLGPFGAGLCRETFKLTTNQIYTFVMFLSNLE